MNTALQFFLADDFVQKSLDGLGRRSGRGRPFGCPSSPGRPASPRGATRSNYSIRPGWPALVRESAGPKPKHRHKFEADDASESWVTRLGDKIASLAARINIAEAEMMTLIAEFDRRRGWEAEGFRSCAHWLAWRIGIKLGPARERVRTAKALEKLPKTAEALGNGVLSYSKARSLTRVATAESEAQLLELAQAASAAKVEETVKVWRQLCRDGEVTAEQARHRSRKLSVFVDQDGMYVVAGRLEPEAGAVFKRALEAAAFALYKADGGEAGGTEPRQRRADAAGLMAERALEAGLAGGGAEGYAETSSAAEAGAGTQSGSDAKSGRSGARSKTRFGARAEHCQVVFHTDMATLREDGEPGRSDLDGVRVSAETSRRIACDASVVPMTHAPDGSVLSVGRKRRTIPPHLRRALEERDRGCRYPGCDHRFTDAHHVKHWADGGETRLDNLLLLCRQHHRDVH